MAELHYQLASAAAERVAQWHMDGRAMLSSVIHHPKAASVTASRRLLTFTVSAPLNAAWNLTTQGARYLAEPLPWAARSLGTATAEGGRMIRRAVLAPVPIHFDAPHSKYASQAQKAFDERSVLQSSYSAAIHANRLWAQLIVENPRSIEVDLKAYLKHMGLALPLKAAETLAEVALAHAFPILTATTLGRWLFAGPEFSALTPSTQEGSLVQFGAALGLGALLGDAMARTLLATNFSAFDHELGERVSWQRQAKHDQQRLLQGMRVLKSLDQRIPPRMTRGELKKLKRARLAAQSLQDRAAWLRDQNSVVATEAGVLLSQSVEKCFLEKSVSLKVEHEKSSFEQSKNKQGVAKNESKDVDSKLSFMIHRITFFIATWRQEKKNQRLMAYERRLEQDEQRLARKMALDACPSVALRLRRQWTRYKRQEMALVKELHTMGKQWSANHEDPIWLYHFITKKNQRDKCRKKAALIKSLSAHPSVSVPYVSPRHLFYNRRSKAFEREKRRYMTRAKDVLEAAVPAQSSAAHQRLFLQRRSYRAKKIKAKAKMASIKAKMAGLDGQLAILLGGDKHGIALQPLVDNRLAHQRLQKELDKTHRVYIHARERQKRTSLYVAPGVVRYPHAPALVNHLADIIWYTLAVSPAVNLLYWAARLGWSTYNERRFDSSLFRGGMSSMKAG